MGGHLIEFILFTKPSIRFHLTIPHPWVVIKVFPVNWKFVVLLYMIPNSKVPYIYFRVILDAVRCLSLGAVINLEIKPTAKKKYVLIDVSYSRVPIIICAL